MAEQLSAHVSNNFVDSENASSKSLSNVPIEPQFQRLSAFASGQSNYPATNFGNCDNADGHGFLRDIRRPLPHILVWVVQPQF